MDFAELQRRRFQFLETVFEATHSKAGSYVAETAIGEHLGFDADTTYEISDFLVNEGLLEKVGIHGITIAHQGRVEIEKAFTEPDRATQHFPAHIMITGGVNAIQMNTDNSTQTVSVSSNALPVAEIKQWCESLKVMLSDIGLNSSDQSKVSKNINILESECDEPTPDKNIVKTVLGRISEVVQNVGTHMVADQLLRELPALLHRIQ